MTVPRTWWKALLAALVAVFLLQLGASLLVRTRRMHSYLVARLAREFGRPVEVSSFEAQLLPAPRLDALEVTVGEDPAFGNEYFLRAEGLSASLRWAGLLHGRFELGTLSLSHPSLILVRNAEHRWNLERWLPPAKSQSNAQGRTYGPPAPVSPGNRLQRIDFDDGRVNFKEGNDKQPFAFINVSGSVEQVGQGRWHLRLEATPWRSGVSLQSTGTLSVRGDLAGTSARLQPAEIQVHWAEASLADFFRLWKGQDFGVRGTFGLDGSLKSEGPGGSPPSEPWHNIWKFSLQARAGHIHRWNLSERSDNPGLNVKLGGNVYSDGMAVQPAEFLIEGRLSNVRGTFALHPAAADVLSVRADSIGIQAADLLAWYRAFHADVDAGISAKQFFTGAFSAKNWPLQLENAAFSSPGGELIVPGIASPIAVGAVEGGRRRGKFSIEPVRIEWESPAPPEDSPEKSARKRRSGAVLETSVDVAMTQDFGSHSGEVSVAGRTDAIAGILGLARAFGHPINHGWELTGSANGALRWHWLDASLRGKWDGHLGISHAQLQAAGLNLPVTFTDARVNFHDGKRTVQIAKAEGLGGEWSGEISEAPEVSSPPSSRALWQFQLHTNQLDAAELDRWVGPRARPNWLQRLLSSLVGGGDASAAVAASDLVRSIAAEGELRVDSLRIEKLQLQNVRASGSLRDLHLDVADAEAQWAGGLVHGTLKAQFLPRPRYEVALDLDHVNVSQLPGGLASRLGGLAAGKLLLSMQGVGRDELLRSLSGRGEVSLKNVELRGWDVSASFADGLAHSGISRWSSGKGSFRLRDRAFVIEGLRLDGGTSVTLVNGKVSFTRDADLEIESTGAGHRVNVSGAGRVLKIFGPLDGPRVSLEKAAIRQPAD
jgi:hypothetical protein